MAIRVGINGFGRIGRVIFRTCLQNSHIEVAAVNDPAIDNEYITYLMKFDSTHGKLRDEVTHGNADEININGKPIRIFHEKQPELIPWHVAGVEYVIEASGMFTNVEKASAHLSYEGVKRVLVTAPSVNVPMIIHGVNDHVLPPEQKVLSCTSSTLYCLAPIIKVLEDKFGVSEGFITSIHAMTPSLKPLDGLCIKGKHWRDHRSIHQNIIPAKTGACKALGKIIPKVRGKMTGIAFRVPIVNVSVLDITVRLTRPTNLTEIIKAVDEASLKTMKGIIKVSRDESVSSDFIGDSCSCTVDADSCLQLTPEFFKLICWYENEYSYACRVLDSIFFSEKQLNEYETKLKQSILIPKNLNTHTENRSKIKDSKNILIENTENSRIDSLKIRPSHYGPKPMSSSQPPSLVYTFTNRENKTTIEMSKEWDDCPKQKLYTESDKIQNCIEFEPNGERNKSNQRRLDNIKREFSKMINITEDLLRKSNCSNISANSGATNSIRSKFESCNNTNNSSRNMFLKVHADNPYRNNSLVHGDSNSVVSSSNVCIESSPRFNIPYQKNESQSSINSSISTSIPCIEKSPHFNLPLKRNVSKTSNNILKIDKDCFVEVTLRPSKPLFSSRSNNDKTKLKPTKNDSQITVPDANLKKQITETINSLIDGLNENIEKKIELNIDNITGHDQKINNDEELQQSISSIPKTIDENESPKNLNNTHPDCEDKKPVEVEVIKYQDIRLLDEKLRARNIQLLGNTEKESRNADSDNNSDNVSLIVETVNTKGEEDISKQILVGLSRHAAPDPIVIVSQKSFRSASMTNTGTTVSNAEIMKKQDIYDKLDSASVTDSEISLNVDKKQSQVLNITDLTNSLEDLERLDKICKIIEISDELSDQLFSNLNKQENSDTKKKWSFRELCDRIKLDEFCDNVFGKV